MTSKLTRERIEQYANDPRMCNINDEIRELARMALAAMESEPVMFCMEGNDLDPEAVSTCREVVDAWVSEWNTESRSPGEPIYCTVPLYRHAQQPVVQDERKSFESFMAERFGDSVDHRRAKNGDQGYMAWDMVVAWIVWQARAMLQAGNSPVIPDGLIAAVNRLLDSDGSRGCYSAIRCYDAREEVERMLAAVPPAPTQENI
ncbi:hypothetical protein PGN04_30710 [Klebsiella quasipneumoniae subsp. quasipneumoniae]|uniref:hypothetical protein n=1 Tax=Klebsiella quasipneumoniae TaxID=1463165 RepID=UPI0022F040B2|nr:hypothetical protein [Klebsiella quasipneumoniae]MDA5092156.1 hypothetical protein [Klebsiella quasipneumoniae subsp. quasipneumoniae]